MDRRHCLSAIPISQFIYPGIVSRRQVSRESSLPDEDKRQKEQADAIETLSKRRSRWTRRKSNRSGGNSWGLVFTCKQTFTPISLLTASGMNYTVQIFEM